MPRRRTYLRSKGAHIISFFAVLLGLSIGLSSPSGIGLHVSEISAKCDPGRSNDYYTRRNVGSQRTASSNTVGGVYAYIENYSPWIYPVTSADSHAASWVMVRQQSTQLYAQVGWKEIPYGSRWTFVEWKNELNQTEHRDNFSPQSQTTGSSYYAVLYDPSTDVWTFQVAGSTILTVQGYDVSDFNRNAGQITGETHSRADQMPGGYSSPMEFTNAHIYIGSWQAFAGNDPLNSDSSLYTLYGTSTTDFSIWDNSCAS